MDNFHALWRDVLDQRKCTQKELSDKLGVTPGYVSKTRKTEIPSDHFLRGYGLVFGLQSVEIEKLLTLARVEREQKREARKLQFRLALYENNLPLSSDLAEGLVRAQMILEKHIEEETSILNWIKAILPKN